MKPLLVPLALASALACSVTTAEAARPPLGRTYYTIAVGLNAEDSLQAQCFVFSEESLCSLDGLICGSWRPSTNLRPEMALTFDVVTLANGDLVHLEGEGRLDTRGPQSSLAGAGHFELTEGGVRNFSFAAREIDRDACLDLIDQAPSDDPSPIVGNGRLVTEQRNVPDFHGLAAGGVGRIEVRLGATQSLRITADENLLPILTSEVSDGRLILGSSVPFRSQHDVLYEITVRAFDEIVLAGVLAANLADLDTDTLTVTVSGVSALTAAGRADRQTVSVSGVSRYFARDLDSREVEIDVVGVSTAVVSASDRLSGSVSGGAILEYLGNPVLDVRVDPISTLRRAD